jgi:hypothetical protein
MAAAYDQAATPAISEHVMIGGSVVEGLNHDTKQ